MRVRVHVFRDGDGRASGRTGTRGGLGARTVDGSRGARAGACAVAVADAGGRARVWFGGGRGGGGGGGGGGWGGGGGGVGGVGRGSWKSGGGGGARVVRGGSGKRRMVGVGMPWADQVEEVVERCLGLSGVRSARGLKKLSSELARLRLGGEVG